MAIKFNCPKCGKKIGVPESAAGKTGKCPGCGTAVTVPKNPALPPARPEKQGGTDYTFRLSEADHKALEELAQETLQKNRSAQPTPAQGVRKREPLLTEEDRRRIEEEERFRAEARARAERQVRSKETPPYPMSSPAARLSNEPGAHAKASTKFKPTCSVCGGETVPGELTCFRCSTEAPRAFCDYRAHDLPRPSGVALMNRCPQCGSGRVTCNREIGCFFVVFLFVSMGIGLIMYPFLPKTCKCADCGAKWKP